MSAAARCWFIAFAAVFASPVVAIEPGDTVENFRLLDQSGRSHELYYQSDAKAVVVMVQGNGCPIVRHALPTLKEIRERYRSQGVEFLLLNSNLQDNRDSIAAEAREFSIDFPILVDDAQLVGEALDVVRTSEVFVIDPQGWKLAYRGPIDDRLSYEKQRPARNHYLIDALDAMLAGRPVATPKAQGVGCLVNFPERERRSSHAQISYVDEVAPVLQEKCVACHQTGGVAPWAMTSYAMVKGFAPMIREVIRTQRMPPWHADPHYGQFRGDRSLTPDQRKLLVHWIEAGAPRGEGDDPLERLTPTPAAWRLGEPDLIVDIPAFDVPPTGVVEYQFPRIPNPLDHDVWIRAIETQPGDPAVVHHIITFIDDPSLTGGRRTRQGGVQVGGYAPGLAPVQFPADTGIFLPRGAELVFQLHYTPNGKAVTDHSRIGLHVSKEPPRYPIHTGLIAKFNFEIPPEAKAHSETVERTWDRDIIVYSVMPHAHLRGKAAKLTVLYPDGRSEVLLNVPRYDFSWQTSYALSEPKLIPKGAKFVWDMTWDNSRRNPANPDSSATVRWGDQTFEEMGIGFFGYRYTDETAEQWLKKRAERQAIAGAARTASR